jgi:hypothetical protein
VHYGHYDHYTANNYYNINHHDYNSANKGVSGA